ncbi:hypothetical protein GCM10020331_095730 [Ectobacillus funiculus]
MQDVNAAVAVVSEQTYSVQGTDKKMFFSEKNLASRMLNGKTLCEGLNELGKIAEQYGLKLVFHHHMGTGVQTLAEIDRLMEKHGFEPCASVI